MTLCAPRHGALAQRLPLPALLLFLAISPAVVPPPAAAPVFPALTGRVVDQAGLLSPAAEQALSAELDRHEMSGGEQVVVVTLASLQGYTIEDYGYQLGRHWGIGREGRNNGALLIVAPAERKVRIEVGYGLEGTLTDALSHDIIQTVMLPRFRRQAFEAGIQEGVAAVLDVLGGTYEPRPERISSPPRGGHGEVMMTLLFMTFVIGEILAPLFKRRVLSGSVLGLGGGVLAGLWGGIAMGTGAALAVFLVHMLLGAAKGRGGSRVGGWPGGGVGGRRGNFGRGGFSGGGGSFGGGGASGGW